MTETDELPNGQAIYCILRCRTLRELAGMSMNALAASAKVDRGTVSKMERRHPVTGAIAGRVFNALNVAHRSTLTYEDEVSTSYEAREAKNKTR